MLTRRLLAVVFALTLLGAMIPAAQADEVMNFVSGSATCTGAQFVFEVEPLAQVLRSAAVVGGNTGVEAWDSDNTLLGTFSDNTILYYGGIYEGTIPFSHTPIGPVTLRLYYEEPILERPAAAEEGDILADTMTLSVNCGEVVPVAGCDMYVNLTGAVVGQFVADTPAYWGPDVNSQTENPTITIAKGKTLYVFGLDESGQFYKVLLQCRFLWVPKNTLGPNPDKVWNNTPLPTRVVH